MTITEIMSALGSTDNDHGRSWDPEMLREAAERCAAGGYEFDEPGYPTEQKEKDRFLAAWQECQEKTILRYTIREPGMCSWANAYDPQTAMQFRNLAEDSGLKRARVYIEYADGHTEPYKEG